MNPRAIRNAANSDWDHPADCHHAYASILWLLQDACPDLTEGGRKIIAHAVWFEGMHVSDALDQLNG